MYVDPGGAAVSVEYLGPIALGFFVLFAITSRSTQSLLAPAPLWNLMWFFSFATSAIFGARFYYSPKAMMLLAAAAASFNVGCLLASGRAGEAPDRSRAVPARIPYALTFFCLVLSAAGVATLSRDLGTSIFSIRSFGALLALGQQNATALFRGEAGLGSVTKVAFAAMQVGFVLVGAQLRVARSRRILVTLVAFVGVAFLWSTITTQRTYLLVPIVWAVGGYIAAACWEGSRTVAPRTIIRAAGIASALVFAVVWLRAVRTGGTGATVDSGAFSSSLPWLAGYLPAFSAWFDNGGVILDGDVPGFFGGVTGLLGSRGDGQSGGNFYIGEGAVSNAPTMMRDVFMVGGPWLAIGIVILLGLASHTAYRRSLRGSASAAALYSGCIAFILWAPNAWFFSYGGRMLAWIVLLAAGIYLNQKRLKRTGRSPGARRPSRVRHRPSWDY